MKKKADSKSSGISHTFSLETHQSIIDVAGNQHIMKKITIVAIIFTAFRFNLTLFCWFPGLGLSQSLTEIAV